jgi:hypothetical protein
VGVAVGALYFKTQAERFADFMADSIAHGGPVAKGTVRRHLDQHAEFIGETTVRFRHGSEIQRADKSLTPTPPKQSRGMGR